MKNKKATPAQIATVAELARTLCENPCNQGILSAAAEQIAIGNGRLLFGSLLDQQRTCGGDEDAAVVSTMALLERMMNASSGVAGYLMLRLQPVAGRQHLAHIADGIGLHIDAHASEDLADLVMLLATEGVGSGRRKYYEAWAADIRKRSKLR